MNTSTHQQKDVELAKIPDAVYHQMVDMFAKDYHFKNGERMRISNYYVKISRSLSDIFVQFIHDMINGLQEQRLPNMPAPEGFAPQLETSLKTEQEGGFSFGSFDMAVTETQLQNIEFQAIATYPLSAAKLNQHLIEQLDLPNAFIFADSPTTKWDDFISLYNTIMGGEQGQKTVLIDRKIKEQKTNFEFFAVQKELGVPVDIVDLEQVFEQDDSLYHTTSSNQAPAKIQRLYNRILLAEALFEDDYPQDNALWKFRFDRVYKDLKFINAPIKQFEVSKRLSPYIDHPFNPDCFELAEAADRFRNGSLNYHDYVWKHKWGAAGHRLILEPNEQELDDLKEHWGDYIAQKKVHFKIFKTDDGQEKIIELRYMTAMHQGQLNIVPMARIGQIVKNERGEDQFRIHFGDNNKEGYGFAPVVIINELV